MNESPFHMSVKSAELSELINTIMAIPRLSTTEVMEVRPNIPI